MYCKWFGTKQNKALCRRSEKTEQIFEEIKYSANIMRG